MDSKKSKQGGVTGGIPQGLRYAQKSPTHANVKPGGQTAAGGGPFAGRMRQGPVPQQLLGRQKATMPQGYPIGPSSRQGMGSRLGDSSSFNDQIQQMQRFKGSFNPSASTNSQIVSMSNVPQAGPSPGQRTNRSSGVGLDETNVPITDRGQAIKSARHQPKALTQMKPNLIGSEYATQPEDMSGYSTGGFKNVSQTSRIEAISFYGGHRIEDQTWRYPSDNKQNSRGGTSQAQSNLYAADQIKFQGDLGDDMLPPNTDDDDSQEERRDDSAAFGRPQGSPRRGHPNKNLMSYQEKLDETPSINQYRQGLNPNTSNSFSQQSQKKQNKNFVTFNEISELELSQSQVQAHEAMNERQMDAYLERIPARITEDQREDEQTDNSDGNGQGAIYHSKMTNDVRRQTNAQETANMMYQLAGPKSKAAGPSRQRQFQTAADMSGYEGDQDQYRGTSRGRFQGGKIESRKKKKVTQQLAAARNANKKYKDAYQAQAQNTRTSQKKASSTVPMSQIELNLDEHMLATEHNQSLNKQAQQPQPADSQIEKQQTGTSAISGISALSLISGTSGLSAAGAQSSEKQAYLSIQQTLKPQSQIVDIQVQPNNSATLPKNQGASSGINDISISEAYSTKPQQIEVDGLRIEHESQPIVTGIERVPQGAPVLKGRASPLPFTASKVVDLTGISGTSVGLPLTSQSQQPIEQSDKEWERRDEAFKQMLEKLSPYERKQLEKQSATKIQKWVRGHIARKTARMQKEINFRQMRKLRRMLSVAYGRTRTKLIRQLTHVVKEAGNLHSDQNYQLWKKYQAHCATIIQRYWRGYSVRYLQIEKFNEKAWKHKQSRLLCALVKGYKTRLLLHEDGYHQGISRVTMDIQRVANQDDGKALIIDVNDKLTLKNLMKRRRQKVIELIRIFNKAYQTQGIIVQLLNQKRRLATQDKLKQMGNQTRSSSDSRQMLSGTQGSQKSLKNVSTLLDYNSAAKGSKKYKKMQQTEKQGKNSKNRTNQEMSEGFRGSFQNKAHKLRGPLGKTTSPDSEPTSGSQHRGSSSPVEENPDGEAASSSDEELEAHHSGTLWPSQANTKGQNTSKQSSDLSSLWPSAHQSKQVDESESTEAKTGGGFASFWPSVQQQTKKPAKKSKRDVVLEERDEENSQASGDVDWLALPVAKPKEAKNQDPERSFQADPIVLKTQPDKYKDNGFKQPIRSFDDEPVGQHTWNPHPDESKGQIQQFGGVGSHQPRDEILQIDDIPIKPMASDPYNLDALQVKQQKSSNMSDGTTSQGPVKGYDFEKMIEVAMQKFGGAPAELAPDKPEKGQAKPGAGGNADEKAQRKEKDDKPVVVDDKKKELLQKRKKYDPRAAIKKSKQQQNTLENDSVENPPADTSDNRIQPSRNATDKLVRSTTPATKTLSDVPEDDNMGPDGAVNQDQNTSQQMPPQPPRPYLKRKTKAVKVEKGNQYKVEGKSRIDCWQKGDKEAGSNYGVYGKGKRKRQSLLKKNQESKTKLGRSNGGSPSPGPRRQPGDRNVGASPAPFRMSQPKLNLNQVDGGEAGGHDHQQYMMAVDPADNEYSEMAGGPDSFLNRGAAMGYPSYSDPHQQYTDSLLPASHLSNHLPVQDLEAQFELLHGPNQEQFKSETPAGTAVAGLSSMDRAAQRMREKQLAEMRNELNSHEFKYSMIPFSAFNNSQEVNLYKANSQIPFLFKDSIPALQKSADFQRMNQAPSLFFKCYSDDLYEAILEDYRSHYVAISNQDLDDDEDGDGEGDEYEEA